MWSETDVQVWWAASHIHEGNMKYDISTLKKKNKKSYNSINKAGNSIQIVYSNFKLKPKSKHFSKVMGIFTKMGWTNTNRTVYKVLVIILYYLFFSPFSSKVWHLKHIHLNGKATEFLWVRHYTRFIMFFSPQTKSYETHLLFSLHPPPRIVPILSSREDLGAPATMVRQPRY